MPMLIEGYRRDVLYLLEVMRPNPSNIDGDNGLKS
jgi:hypothetical protein